MATVKGVWVWNDTVIFNYFTHTGEIVENLKFTSGDLNYDGLVVVDYYGAVSSMMELTYILLNSPFIYFAGNPATISGGLVIADIDQNYKIWDFGETEQEVSDSFYAGLTANAVQQVASDPGPDWANSFIKTASGNKAVEKVWIKQGSSLNVVWEKPLITYTVTNTLTHCTSNNSAKTATQGTSYTATITANSGYTLDGATVSVKMGGTNITSTAYSNGVITIESVTGDIVVRVSAVKDSSQTPVNIIVDLTIKLNNGGIEPNGIMLMSALTGDQRPADNITIGSPQSKFTWENVMYMAGEDLLLFVQSVPQGTYELSIENSPVATATFPRGTPVPLQEYIQLFYGTVFDGQTVRLTLVQQ